MKKLLLLVLFIPSIAHSAMFSYNNLTNEITTWVIDGTTGYEDDPNYTTMYSTQELTMTTLFYRYNPATNLVEPKSNDEIKLIKNTHDQAIAKRDLIELERDLIAAQSLVNKGVDVQDQATDLQNQIDVLNVKDSALTQENAQLQSSIQSTQSTQASQTTTP